LEAQYEAGENRIILQVVFCLRFWLAKALRNHSDHAYHAIQLEGCCMINMLDMIRVKEGCSFFLSWWKPAFYLG